MEESDGPTVSKTQQGLAVLIFCGIVIGTYFGQGGNAPRVTVVQPETRKVSEIVAVSGTVYGSTESLVAPEITAPIAEVMVAEGDRVKAGQPLYRLSNDVLKEQARQAQANLLVVQARYEQTARRAPKSEYQQVEANSLQNLRTARADLRVSQQDLSLLESGTRLEQMGQAKADLERLQSEYRYAKQDHARQTALFEEGVISKAQLEQSENKRLGAAMNLEKSRQRWLELEQGPRKQEILMARSRLERAEAVVQGAREDREARLLRLDESPRPEDVKLAAAQVVEAEANHAVTLARLAQTQVSAPYEGLITMVRLDPGDTASPSTPVLEIVSLENIEVRADIDSAEARYLDVGQRVEILSELEGDKTLYGTLSKIGSRFDSNKGTVEVRIRFNEPVRRLWPGQNVDLNIVKEEATERVILPVAAVRSAGPRPKVFVLDGQRISLRRVDVGVLTPLGYPVRRGLEADDLVVVSPGNFEDGQRVRGSTEDEI